jgi:hypothetical protein|tara:strand:- start:578 stop:1030 length:453 start_codon:yes stop_codon:yes gene_type:complete
MGLLKYLAIIPAVAAVVASLYGGLQYVTGLQNTIETNEKHIASMQMSTKNDFQSLDTMMNSEVEKLDIRLKAVNELYKQGREEMLIEMTNFATQIARIQVLAESLRDGQYKLASEAELRAMEQSYYKLNDSIVQLKYDLKEMQRQLNGGY